jgi:hypothetical protein
MHFKHWQWHVKQQRASLLVLLLLLSDAAYWAAHCWRCKMNPTKNPSPGSAQDEPVLHCRLDNLLGQLKQTPGDALPV